MGPRLTPALFVGSIALPGRTGVDIEAARIGVHPSYTVSTSDRRRDGWFALFVTPAAVEAGLESTADIGRRSSRCGRRGGCCTVSREGDGEAVGSDDGTGRSMSGGGADSPRAGSWRTADVTSDVVSVGRRETRSDGVSRSSDSLWLEEPLLETVESKPVAERRRPEPSESDRVRRAIASAHVTRVASVPGRVGCRRPVLPVDCRGRSSSTGPDRPGIGPDFAPEVLGASPFERAAAPASTSPRRCARSDERIPSRRSGPSCSRDAVWARSDVRDP
ncbi:hypothetical protein C485_12628 [Natrinema altunense JCM 12890]|uniref:Uncharacterized protein n=1 Tax=Natrinema altunense (strain JCM 12890 / CGMCC 1.3731 / AJ2) TaxID=1227494 RepID=L9ZG83_NATA2|nr:hypothetical protein C485_12628 [Natrinema altunense JCM 12890]